MIGSFQGEYRFLSNFYPSPLSITLMGKHFFAPTVEHAFQSAKSFAIPDWSETNKIRWVESVMAEPTPGKAKRAGRLIGIDPEVWDRTAPDIMRMLVGVKFMDPVLEHLLLATGDEELVEGNTWGDQVWGKVNGKGKNLLGKILMDIRDERRTA